MKNKKANITAILLIIGALFLLMFIGLGMVIGSSVINWVFDEAVPELTNIGIVGSSNFSQYADITITPVNTFIQQMTWLTGVLYVFGIIGILGLAFVFKTTGNRWFMAFYVALVFILVIAAIFISNIYEDFYDDGGELGDRLKEHTLLSYLILYSPMIMSIIAFVAGIILFSGSGEEGFV